MNYTVILNREDDGGFSAVVPALPGCVSQGDSRPETMRNIREAIELYLEELRAAGEAIPSEVAREIVEISVNS
jgi:predicted RNase H-like HicB family nuclease